MSSPVSKQTQKCTDEIEEQKQEIPNQNAANEPETQNREQVNRDLSLIISDFPTQIQLQPNTNRDQNEEHEDQNQEQADCDKTEEPDQNPEHLPSTQNDELRVYSYIRLEDGLEDRSQPCTIWWCPEHSDFENIVQHRGRETLFADRVIVGTANKRFNYWKNKTSGSCCFRDRQTEDNFVYVPPSNWQDIMIQINADTTI